MEMVKKQTAFYVSIIQWVGCGLFGFSFVGAFITGLITSIVLNLVATEINIINKDTENDTNENETNEKEEN